MGKLFFTIAPARSGKSTFVQKWLKEKVGRGVVNDDQIRLGLHNFRYSSVAEPMVYAISRVLLRHNLSIYDETIYDETNTSVRSMKNILEIDPDAQPIFIDTPIEVCIQRAYDSGQSDLVEHAVIQRHFDNLKHLCMLGNHDVHIHKNLYRPTEADVLNAVEILRKEVKK